MILHTINKPAALDQCRDLIAGDDMVVLLEDGVYLALQALPFPACALSADLAARGLQGRLAGAVRQIDYAGFVDLSVRADKICAWF